MKQIRYSIAPIYPVLGVYAVLCSGYIQVIGNQPDRHSMTERLKHKLEKFLKDNFNGLKLVTPLFYNHPISIRFDLQTDTENAEYFNNVRDRAATIFNAAFGDNDNVYVVIQRATFNRSKIRPKNYLFRQISNPKEIDFQKLFRPYPPEWHIEKWNRAIIKTVTSDINSQNIIKGISYKDFPTSGKAIFEEVYFINLDRKTIFNMYDDRGCDLLAADKDTLLPIYEKLNHLILDHDRKKIDEKFNKLSAAGNL